MDSSRNPLVCPPIHSRARGSVPDRRLTGRIQQFPQARLHTPGDQHGVRIRPCGILEEFVWSPRGFLELSTISCTCVNNRVNPVEQLEERSRMNRGQPVNLHRRLVFILETPRGHPHGTTPSDQWIRPQSTESTAPTTTSVLLFRDLSSKQGVWKSRSNDAASVSRCFRHGEQSRPMSTHTVRSAQHDPADARATDPAAPRTARSLLDPHSGGPPGTDHAYGSVQPTV